MSSLLGKRGRPPGGKRGRGRPRTTSAPARLTTDLVPKKRKQWRDEDMCAALHAVQHGQLKISEAVKKFNVPRQTLRDRISGRVAHGTKPGPKPYLTKEEESEFAEFLVETAKAGYGKSRQQVKAIAENVAQDKGVLGADEHISDGWYCRFMERQVNLSLRKGDPIANVRMDCLDEETMTEYFAMLKDLMTKKDLLDKPNQIYNVDETGMPLDHRPPKVVAQRGQKKVRCRTSGNRSQVTVIACVSATGHSIPPYVIFDAKGMNYEWMKGEVPGTRYAVSDTGWVDTELFKGWLVMHLLKHAVAGRPLLLVLDGHSTHYQPETIKFAQQNGVIMMCLPPHTTHESQPLDASVFKPLKQNWHKACHKFVQRNPGKVITKYDFSPLLHEAWNDTMIPTVIASGFRRSGIYPFNPKALDYGPSKSHEKTNPTSQVSIANSSQAMATSSTDIVDPEPSFTADEEKRFQRRYENSYDIPEPRYLLWLKGRYPERFKELSSPQELSLAAAFSENTESDLLRLGLMTSSTVTCLDVQQPEGVASADTEQPLDLVPDMSPPPDTAMMQDMVHTVESHIPEQQLIGPSGEQSTVQCNDDLSPPPDSTLTEMQPGEDHTPEQQLAGVPPSNNACTMMEMQSSMEDHPPEQHSGKQSVVLRSSKSMAAPAPPEHEGELKYISKYLVQYVPVKPKKPSTASRVTGARILTSEECAQLIFEREEKKKKEKEEKEARKAAREQKKKEKEEAARKKAELAEKRKENAAKKKEEAAKKKEEAAKRKEEAIKRKEEAARKKAEQVPQSRKRHNRTVSTRDERETASDSEDQENDDDDDDDDDEGEEDGTESGRVTRSASRFTTDATVVENSNQCCVCFRTYEEDQAEDTGFQWVKCVCQRWVHEDCYSEVLTDKFGRELICPYCVL